MTTDTTQQEALDHAARCLQTIQHGVGRALPLVQRVIEGRIRPDSPELDTLISHLADSARSAESAHQSLVYGAGAQEPGLRTAREDLRLDQLHTPNTRALLEVLQIAVSAAREVDLERGWVDEGGECIGWAETLAGLELGLRREVHGAKGRD